MNFVQQFMDANHLGIKEKFRVSGYAGHFRFNETYQLEEGYSEGSWELANDILPELLAGTRKVLLLRKAPDAIQRLVEVFGVEYEEPFRIESKEMGIHPGKFMFTKFGFVTDDFCEDAFTLYDLITGRYTVVKENT